MPYSSQNISTILHSDIERRVSEYRSNLRRFYGNCPLFSSEIEAMLDAYRHEQLTRLEHPLKQPGNHKAQ